MQSSKLISILSSRHFRSSVIFMSIWFASSVAFSNGSLAPELPLLANAKSSAEYPILRKLQDHTLELQLLEITIKNRRDAGIESKISTALSQIEQNGSQLGQRFKELRTSQIDHLFALFTIARKYGNALGVNESEWDELIAGLKDGRFKEGTLIVHGKRGSLNLVTLVPLYIGKQLVWSMSLPALDGQNYWVSARQQALANKNLKTLAEAKVAESNKSYETATALSKMYFSESYSKLYGAFETQRYAILQRVMLARKALQELEKNPTSMGTPEEYASLYNQVLDHLFSYGIDVSLSSSQRDFAVKGFLFAGTPEEAQNMVQKLKYKPSSASYNSPSS